MANESSGYVTIVVEWLYPSPCSCGETRWYVVVGGDGVGWVHLDDSGACEQDGA